MKEFTMEDLKALSAHARKNAVPPFVIEGEPYIMLDSETGKMLHPDEWQIVEIKKHENGSMLARCVCQDTASSSV